MASSERASSRFFLSYRRDDSPAHAGRLADHLTDRFGPGSVFMDVESIGAGADFVREITAAIYEADAVLVVIGPGWLGSTDAGGPSRLEDSSDFVRVELETALRSQVRVIPVLVGGASMPGEHRLPQAVSSLARLNAVELLDRRWREDVEALFDVLERRVVVCPRCGRENPVAAAYCMGCAAPLQVRASTEERKVVSILFCDLVGFTPASEGADPEDVRARLTPYHERVRREIEAFGGAIERLVGDAVVAVFGAPVTHEDDAERAVRAGLAVLQAIEDLNESDPDLGLSVRVAVDTGETVVAIDARPELGEAMVGGDVVNTASRLQSAAPVGTLVVGAMTHRATGPVFEWDELPAVELKGRTVPIPVWRALSARARFGVDILRAPSTPFVGRDEDLSLLKNLFARAQRDRSLQLVTIVGGPGVGKSRLVAEFAAWVDELPQLVRWRQGRCLPYGDGISYWALGEIVKAQTGILESDSPAVVTAKLEAALSELPEDDRAWLVQRLSPLVGAEGSPAGDRDEAFTAWRRFLELIASEDPAVIVVEDLHWADPALLEFLEYLVDWAEGVCLYVLSTARPEFLERRAGWGGGKRNTTTVDLSPLSEEDTERLVQGLLETTVLPAELQRAVLDRAGGNPLYAEEFVRMLKDRGLLVREGKVLTLSEESMIPVPDTVQALIAARIDALPADLKSLLQDAAVVGKVFWSGALAAMDDRDERDVRRALHELAKRELIHQARLSSMQDEAEYAFWHILIRDVAYAQISRANRAAKHVAAAEWIEAGAGERVGDLADVIGYHLMEAFDLAAASGRGDDADRIRPRAIRFLSLAGDRALYLHPPRAVELLERALTLAHPDSDERFRLQLRLGNAFHRAQRYSEADRVFERLRQDPQAQSDRPLLAEALVSHESTLHALGKPTGYMTAVNRALELLGSDPPPQSLMEILVAGAGEAYNAGRDEDALDWVGRAIALGSERGLPLNPRLLAYRGSCRCSLGDRGGLADIEEAIASASSQGLLHLACSFYNDLADGLRAVDGPAAALAEIVHGLELSERIGGAVAFGSLETSRIEALRDLGRWDDALSEVKAFLKDASNDHAWVRLSAELFRALVLAERGDPGPALSQETEFLGAARSYGQSQLVVEAFETVALALDLEGRRREAAERLAEFASMDVSRRYWTYAAHLPQLVRVALRVAGIDAAGALAKGVDPTTPVAAAALAATRAQHAEKVGRLEEAATLYRTAVDLVVPHSVYEGGHAALGLGRCTLALGNPEGLEDVRRAREVFLRLGAVPARLEADSLLGSAEANGF